MKILRDLYNHLFKLNGGYVPNNPLKPVVYSEEWNWDLHLITEEMKTEIVEPTGNWMIEQQYNGNTTLLIQVTRIDGTIEYCREHQLKIFPEVKKIFNIVNPNPHKQVLNNGIS